MKQRLAAYLILIPAIIALSVVGACAGGESLSYRGTLDAPAKPSRGELEWGINPFGTAAGQGREGREAPPLTLSAIFYNPRGPSAIINERIVYRGSIIEGQKIVDIGKTHVILQWKGTDRRLEISAGPAVQGAQGGR